MYSYIAPDRHRRHRPVPRRDPRLPARLRRRLGDRHLGRGPAGGLERQPLRGGRRSWPASWRWCCSSCSPRTPSRPCSWSSLVGVLGSVLAINLQLRLMHAAGDAQMLGAALNHSALNTANGLGAWLGAVVIADGLGYRAPSLLGAGLALAGLLVFGLGMLVERRGAVRGRCVAPTRRARRRGPLSARGRAGVLLGQQVVAQRSRPGCRRAAAATAAPGRSARSRWPRSPAARRSLPSAALICIRQQPQPAVGRRARSACRTASPQRLGHHARARGRPGGSSSRSRRPGPASGRTARCVPSSSSVSGSATAQLDAGRRWPAAPPVTRGSPRRRRACTGAASAAASAGALVAAGLHDPGGVARRASARSTTPSPVEPRHRRASRCAGARSSPACSTPTQASSSSPRCGSQRSTVPSQVKPSRHAVRRGGPVAAVRPPDHGPQAALLEAPGQQQLAARAP